jgi:hypothetical protein
VVLQIVGHSIWVHQAQPSGARVPKPRPLCRAHTIPYPNQVLSLLIILALRSLSKIRKFAVYPDTCEPQRIGWYGKVNIGNSSDWQHTTSCRFLHARGSCKWGGTPGAGSSI